MIEAWAVTVVGVDVFVAGYERNSSGYRVAKIWKNAIATSLSDGTKNAFISAISVSPTDIYAVGYEDNGVEEFAKVWKNGAMTSLVTNGIGSAARSIFISGNDIHISGFVKVANGNSRAVIWTNGIPVDLTNGFSSIAGATGVYIDGANVYAVGYDIPNATGLSKAVVWKNGNASSLTNILGSERATSIKVFNHDVYVAGFEIGGVGSRAKTWKNGSLLYSTEGSNTAQSSFLFVN